MNISVIITLYNKDKYINRCMKSLTNQSYDDFEAIIIDDCSTDDGLTICQDLINEYRGDINWRIIPLEKNIGIAAVRNIAIKEAKGNYIFFVDGDDEITPDCIKSFVRKRELIPDVEMIIGKITSIPYNEYYNTEYYNNCGYINDNMWVREHFFRKENRIPVNPVNKLIKKDFLIKNNLYFKPEIYHEDELWMFFVAKKLTKLSFVDKITYIRHYVPNSIMTNKAETGHIKSWNVIFINVFCNIDTPYTHLQVKRYLREYLFRYEELSKIGATNCINNILIRHFIKTKDFMSAFIIYRMCSSIHWVSKEYKEYFMNTWEKTELRSKRLILKKELDILRVRLGIGKYF